MNMLRRLLILVCVASALAQESQESEDLEGRIKSEEETGKSQFLLGVAKPVEAGKFHKNIRTVETKSLLLPRMHSGNIAFEGQFPWHAILHTQTVKFYGNSYEVCGGSIISSEWILTAAHCVYGGLKADVYVGVVRILPNTPPTSTSTELIIHEGYTGNDKTVGNNDIALIKLSQPLSFNDKIYSIALSSENIPEGTKVTISGTGKTFNQDTDVGNILRYLDLTILNNRECQNIAAQIPINFEGLICAIGEKGTDKTTCQGDSGGPLVTRMGEGQPVQVGLTSFGPEVDCVTAGPITYTSTAYFREWIRSKTNV